MVRKRTRSREIALQFLYQWDVRGDDVLDSLDAFVQEQAEDPESAEYARTLVTGTREHRTAVDTVIQDVAKNWDLRRMAIVDRNILRMAAFELLFGNETPPLVVINEAIDLAKRFSTEHSGSFVNGILDRIRLKREDPGPGTPPAGAPEQETS